MAVLHRPAVSAQRLDSLSSWAPLRWPPRSVVALKSVPASDYLSAEELQSALTDVKATRETLRSTSAGFLFILRDYLEIWCGAPHPAVTKPEICSNLGDYFGFLSLALSLFFLHLSVSVKFKSLGCRLKSRGEGRITGATPDDVRIIIYLNDLGLYFLLLDSCWLEWRESWRSSHTLLKVCMAPQDHILLIILILGWQRDTVSPQVCTKAPHCVVQISQLSDLIQIPCVCLRAIGCFDTLGHIKTCFYSHLSSLTWYQMWQTVVAPPKCCCYSQGDSPLCINHSWPSCCAAFWMEHMFAARRGL